MTDFSELVATFGLAAKNTLNGPGEPEAALSRPVAALLENFGEQILHRTVVLHEEVREDSGNVRPDYGVRVDKLISGHIELKRPGTSLDPTTYGKTTHNGKQWKRLRNLPNLLHTNGLEWGAVAKLGQWEDRREIIRAMGIFSGRHFPHEVILWAVRWYCRYGVSYRDLEEMMTERGAPVDHTTIYRWVQKYAPELDKQTRWYRQVPDWQARSWRVDETYIRVGGKWCYLYRAITAGGQTLDFYLSPKRNVAAAKRFLAKTLRATASAGFPRVISTDKAPALAKAIVELKAEGICPQTVEHRQVKYLNNVLEGDHGRLKRILGPKGAFKNRTSAYRTLKGMEAMHSLRKGQGTMFAYGHPNPDAVIVSRAFEAA